MLVELMNKNSFAFTELPVEEKSKRQVQFDCIQT